MSKLSEPDDVEFFVGDVKPIVGASIETEKIIEAYKKRPDYHFEAEEAERILAALGINARDHGMPDAQSLLDHWRRCVAELHKPDLSETQGEGLEHDHNAENVHVSADLPKETQR